MSDAEYASDVGLMLGAVQTDSRAQQDRLVKRLGATPWVKAVDGSGEHGLWEKPGNLYIVTERLRSLFDGVDDVLFVDPDISCLKGEEVRRLLERSGATRYLKPIEVKCDLPKETLAEIRRREGMDRVAGYALEDKTIRGLDALLNKFSALDPTERVDGTRDLWNALADLNKRSGSRPFEGVYTWWFFRQTKAASFDAAFVRTLNQRRWIPDSSGNLRCPGQVAFEDTKWEPDTLLQSKIGFKPPLLNQLAREAGIEPGVLDRLLKMGVTSEADLDEVLGVNENGEEPGGSEEDNDRPPSADTRTPIPTAQDGPVINEGAESNDSVTTEPFPADATPREFVSYVRVEPDEGEDADLDELGHSGRMELEHLAIKFIMKHEPKWKETPPNNRGFDLYRGTTMQTATHWCEVKAMTGTLDDRPVGMSSAQFEWARNHGDAYWLYIVERAGTSAPSLVRIRNPAGKAKTFTFDRGWRAVAAADGS